MLHLPAAVRFMPAVFQTSREKLATREADSHEGDNQRPPSIVLCCVSILVDLHDCAEACCTPLCLLVDGEACYVVVLCCAATGLMVLACEAGSSTTVCTCVESSKSASRRCYYCCSGNSRLGCVLGGCAAIVHRIGSSIGSILQKCTALHHAHDEGVHDAVGNVKHQLAVKAGRAVACLH
jgi:hypothetical protein